MSFFLGLLGDLDEGLGGELEVGAFHLEEPAVLLDQGVLGLGHDLDQGRLVQGHERAGDRQAADELGDHPVFEDVVGRDPVEQVAELAVVLGLGLAAEADRLAADPAGDDVVEADERPAADEQDVGRVHLDVLLLGVLAPPLGRDVGDGPFEHLQERLLDPLARDVAGDRDVVVRLADLVDLVDVDDAPLGALQVEVGRVQELQEDVLDVLADVAGLGQRGGVADGEGDVEDPGEGPGEQGLAAAGRADQEDVRLVELDLGVVLLGVDQPLVVVVDGDREDLLGPVLVDHVGVELLLDLRGSGCR